jgi:predicted transcriptional regulator
MRTNTTNTTSSNAAPSNKRFTVDLSPEITKKLDHLVSSRKTTAAQVIRQGIATEDYLRSEAKQGHRILIEREDGSLREIVFRD